MIIVHSIFCFHHVETRVWKKAYHWQRYSNKTNGTEWYFATTNRLFLNSRRNIFLHNPRRYDACRSVHFIIFLYSCHMWILYFFTIVWFLHKVRSKDGIPLWIFQYGASPTMWLLFGNISSGTLVGCMFASCISFIFNFEYIIKYFTFFCLIKVFKSSQYLARYLERGTVSS